MPGKRTFLDTGVLITAFKGQTEDALRALALLSDSSREFIASTYLKLELFPQPTWHQRQAELDFYKTFFGEVPHYAEATEQLAQSALQTAGAHGLEAMDALHIAAANQFNAEEFITTEKATKPIHRLGSPKILHLSDCS